jgi:hypothetical protein
MSMSCGIFVQFFKCEILMSDKFVSFITSCTLCIAVEAQGVVKRRLTSNSEDDGFEFLKNWLLLVVIVTVASRTLYVANGIKINPYSVIF